MSMCVITHDIESCLVAGRHAYDADSPLITESTLFDIASITKVVATTAMAMVLFERGLLNLEEPIVRLVPEFATKDERRFTVTLRMLLAHSSGLPAYVRLFEEHREREILLAAACNVELVHDPLSAAEYSDIGFIILGLALERIAGESMDTFCRREIFEPLGMSATMFCPTERKRCAPTLDAVDFRHRFIQGEVHDENASVMGGVAGHAGVFSTASDLAKFARCMLQGGAPLVSANTVKFFTQREVTPPGTSRALGWDTPSAPSSSGRYFSATSFGHLGFTGTSLWIDPEQRVAIVLLTNRTWPDNNETSKQAIREFRPAFHDVVMEHLKGA